MDRLSTSLIRGIIVRRLSQGFGFGVLRMDHPPHELWRLEVNVMTQVPMGSAQIEGEWSATDDLRGKKREVDKD